MESWGTNWFFPTEDEQMEKLPAVNIHWKRWSNWPDFIDSYRLLRRTTTGGFFPKKPGQATVGFWEPPGLVTHWHFCLVHEFQKEQSISKGWSACISAIQTHSSVSSRSRFTPTNSHQCNHPLVKFWFCCFHTNKKAGPLASCSVLFYG